MSSRAPQLPQHLSPSAEEPDGAEPNGAEPDTAAPRPARWQRLADRYDRQLRVGMDVAVVGICTLFVLLQLGPSNLLSDTTPSGGDMGAHVWGPAYLRDHLLPNLRLSGWAPDWYAGFPTYQFYMVVPSLVIVALNVGFPVGGVMASLLAGLVAGAVGIAVGMWRDRQRRYLALGVAGAALLFVGFPYGVAFKLVSVSGALTLPVAAYAFGRLSGLRFPAPALLAVGTLPFLFYRGFSIYGGNLASTLAGEFAFSMSLSLGLVYLGVVFRGLETGRYRALAAVLLALTGLCHIIPAFWVAAGTVVIVLLRSNRSNAPSAPCVALGLAGASSFLGGFVLGSTALMALGAVLGLVGAWLVSRSVRWLTPVMVVGGMLSAFWVLPFVLRADFVNDMGWEKLPYDLPEKPDASWLYLNGQHLLPSDPPADDLRWVFALAAVGAVLSVTGRLLAARGQGIWASARMKRMTQAGIFLTAMTLLVGVGFVVMPEGRLWNGRILPFYYLSAMLLAMVAVALSVRLLARLTKQRTVLVGGLGALGGLAAMLVVVGLPLGVVWLSEPVQRVDPETEEAEDGYRWPSYSPWQIEATPSSFIPFWADWNYQGYEEKASYREYHDIVTTMERVGDERGCGRALWEYDRELDRYGTPMALMLLPYWTDGCIGSMEGLFFESSMTTPYHFIMQTELSESPSSAQRNMPYEGFNMELGVQHLQLMGVQYYMATSSQAILAARDHPDLTEIATSGPWEVFEVADTELVTPLAYEPAVLSDVGHGATDWLEEPRDDSGQDRYFGPSVQWFIDPAAWDVPLSVDGPSDWQRIEAGDLPEARSIAPAEVSDIEEGRDRISFRVDQVGSPVLVKTSYFPNWQVSGAEGPWRVAPNLMVVVPTDDEVELSYGRTPVEWLAYLVTAGGVVGLVVLARRGRYQFGTAESDR